MESHGYWRMLGLEHKRLYQRNMTLALLIVSGLSALVVAFILSGASRQHLVGARLLSIPGRIVSPGGISAGQPVIHPASQSAFVIGMIDSISIIPDFAEPSVTVSPHPGLARLFWETSEQYDPSIGARPGPEHSGGGFGTGAEDFGFPEEHWARPAPPWPHGQAGSSVHIPGESQAATILVSNIDWPGMPASPTDTGTVVVDITIHRDGTISYQFVSEHPPGKGFRRVTEQALVYRYDYRPRVEFGRPLETTVRLSVTICYDCALSIKSVGGENNLYVGVKSAD